MVGSWIIVIPKPDKALALPQDYRLISLLNVDYKIFITLMVSRLDGLIGSYIHQDQAGFLKGCYMKDKVRQLLNIVDWVKRCKDPILLLFLDSEKAFDRLEWIFLKQVIKKMNFGPMFQQWVTLLYSKQDSNSHGLCIYIKKNSDCKWCTTGMPGLTIIV